MKKTLLILVAICVIGIVGWFIFERNNGGPMQNISPSTAVASSSQDVVASNAPLATSTPLTQAVGQGLRKYQNVAFHFSLSYPEGLSVLEYKEQGGALTVTFENADSSQSFEVYVTPYSKAQIDASRFKTDEPSGTYIQPQDVVIDGARATMFFGNNPIMGDTREVWFIHGGYLYEVATYKPLDSWLATIMATWHFTP